jgi:hypothetical protein
MPTRRQFISICGLSLCCPPALLSGQVAPSTTPTIEQQKGDPDAVYETISFDPNAISQLVSQPGKASFEKWDKGLPLRMISTARTFLGASRDTSPAQITEFLRLFDLPFKDDKGYVPFCAAGVSFCALMTYASSIHPNYSANEKMTYFRNLMPDLEHYYFYPTVSCVSMYHIAAGKNRWIDRKGQPSVVPKPGWIVLYDWDSKGIPDHCGIVVHAGKDKISTIEFNTSGTSGGSQRNGGTVSDKERSYNSVKGYVVTDSIPGRTI